MPKRIKRKQIYSVLLTLAKDLIHLLFTKAKLHSIYNNNGGFNN